MHAGWLQVTQFGKTHAQSKKDRYFCSLPLTQRHNYPHLRLSSVSLLRFKAEHTRETQKRERWKGQERFALSFFIVKKKKKTAANGLKMSQGIITEIFLK